jgi:hypothetical protein
MKILALEEEIPGKSADNVDMLYKQEAIRVWELFQNGTVREIYFRKDCSCAVLMLECEDAEQAGKVLSSLPLAKAGLIRFDIIPLVAYDGFSRLFDEDEGSGK